MNFVNVLTLLLIIIGGLNWGLVGAFDFNLVATIFGAGSMPTRLVYIFVGLSALYQLVPLSRSMATNEVGAEGDIVRRS